MRLSLLDLVPVRAGDDATGALHEAVALARHAEALGFARCWYAEHHAAGRRLASAAPEVVVGHVATATRTIRVGSGAVLLNHHSPYRVAEAFRTLHALHPDRIDLGVGRANGRPAIDVALQNGRDADPYPDDHADRVAELLGWLGRGFPTGDRFAGHEVLPGVAGGPQPWVLGSTPASAPLAGALGLPYCFAAQISPNLSETAAEAYRAAFVPGAAAGGLAAPRLAVAIGVATGADDGEGSRLRAPHDLAQVRAARGGGTGVSGPAPSTAEALAELRAIGLPEPAPVELRPGGWPRCLAGSAARVAADLRAIATATGADELVLVDPVAEPGPRRDGYAALAEALPIEPAAGTLAA